MRKHKAGKRMNGMGRARGMGWVAFLALGLGTASTPAAGFKHPGMLNNRLELDFVRQQVTAGKSPWKEGYGRLSTSNGGWGGDVGSESLGWKTQAYPKVTKEDWKARDAYMDAVAAVYVHALMYNQTRNEAHALKAIEIMDAWAVTLVNFGGIDGNLLPAWITPMIWGAEIIRHVYGKWPADAIGRFEKMLNQVVYPRVSGGSGFNSNWEASMTTTVMAIAIFEDDAAKWKRGLELFDGRLPQAFKAGGKGQETCRDLDHLAMGLSAMGTAAEQAWKQGIDLYSRLDNRLFQAAEYHAKVALGTQDPGCPVKGVLGVPFFELLYNHYHGRKGLAMPNTEKAMGGGKYMGRNAKRAEGYHMLYGYGTYTHAALPKGGDVTTSLAASGAARSIPAVSLLMPGVDGRTGIGLPAFDFSGRRIADFGDRQPMAPALGVYVRPSPRP